MARGLASFKQCTGNLIVRVAHGLVGAWRAGWPPELCVWRAGWPARDARAGQFQAMYREPYCARDARAGRRVMRGLAFKLCAGNLIVRVTHGLGGPPNAGSQSRGGSHKRAPLATTRQRAGSQSRGGPPKKSILPPSPTKAQGVRVGGPYCALDKAEPCQALKARPRASLSRASFFVGELNCLSRAS